MVSIGYQKGSAAEVRYFFTRNAQGDIVGVYRSSDSKLIGTYEYDLWGRPISTTEATAGIDTDNILTKNPFRYRGYYFDEETGFYYLQSRYYDSAIRRFISADSVIASAGTTVEGYNVFGYSFNNPVNKCDPSGYWPIETILVGYLARKYAKAKAEYVYKPAVNDIKNALSKVDGTCTIGKSNSITIGTINFDTSMGVTVDTDGNVALQKTNSGGLTTGGLGIAGSYYCTQTNAPLYRNLEGSGLNIGGSASVFPILAGCDVNFLGDENGNINKKYFGRTARIGMEFPGDGTEAHMTFGETSTIAHINLFDIADWYFDYVEEY